MRENKVPGFGELPVGIERGGRTRVGKAKLKKVARECVNGAESGVTAAAMTQSFAPDAIILLRSEGECNEAPGGQEIRRRTVRWIQAMVTNPETEDVLDAKEIRIEF